MLQKIYTCVCVCVCMYLKKKKLNKKNEILPQKHGEHFVLNFNVVKWKQEEPQQIEVSKWQKNVVHQEKFWHIFQ